jgi:fibronectin type 3 domain-containing protein
MRRISIVGLILSLALALNPARADAQDRVPKNYTVIVGHIVTLTWTDSTALAGTIYNVYVSGVSGGPYTRIGSTPNKKFSDLNAISGVKYYYVVTAVDPALGESAYSSEVAVTIPTP